MTTPVRQVQRRWPAAQRRRTPLDASTGAGAILQLIRNGDAVTRADIVRRTGLSRATVAQRLDALMAQRLVREARGAPSPIGRPPGLLSLNEAGGVVLAADLDAACARCLISDLGGTPLGEIASHMDVGQEPDTVMRWVRDGFACLLRDVARSADDVRGIGIALATSIAPDHAASSAPRDHMTWAVRSIGDWLARYYAAPVLVENRVGCMALGEYASRWRKVEHLLYVALGTGVSCGIVAGGVIYSGAQGAAGDIGHVMLAGHDDAVCHCGNCGCLEAVVARRTREANPRLGGFPSDLRSELIALARSGEARSVRVVREAGRCIGEVVAACVSFFDPDVIVIGGELDVAGEQLLAGVREAVSQRSLSQPTDTLRITTSELGERAGVIGAVAKVIERVLAPDAVDRAIRSRPSRLD